MKTKRIVQLLYTAVIVVVMIALGSCSTGDRALLDTVPSKSPFVGVVDMELLLKRSGAQITEGTITLTPALEKIVRESSRDISDDVSAFEMMCELYGAVNLNEVVYVVPTDWDKEKYLTFYVTDKDAVEAKMNALGAKKSSADDYDIYSGDNWTLAISGEQGWLISSYVDVKSVSGIIGGVEKKESIGAQTGIADFLHSENVVNIAMDTHQIEGKRDKDKAGHRACVSIKVDDSALSLSMQMISADGKVEEFAKGYSDIDTAFLRYVPTSYVAAAAVGLTPDFDSSMIGTMAAMLGGSDISTMAQMLMPVLSKVDGTLAIAVGPAGGAPAIADINIHTWNFLLMAHMAKDDIDATISQLDMLTSQFGLEIYAENIDGYLVVSNREPEQGSESPLAEAFHSQRAALAVNIPAGGEIVKAFDLPWGFNGSVQLDKTALNIRLSLNGTDQGVLPALLEQLTK
jgi:hypothetical protein